jgi:hypothetical protein
MVWLFHGVADAPDPTLRMHCEVQTAAAMPSCATAAAEASNALIAAAPP